MTCRVEGCDRAARSLGLCNGHRSRLRRNGDVRADIPLRTATYRGQLCAVQGCNRAAQIHGYCEPHSRRWRRNGDPGPPEIATRTQTWFNGECLTCVDAQWLADAGVDGDEIAVRLGFDGTPKRARERLRRHLRRHGHRELSDQLSLAEKEPIMQVDDMTVPPVPPVPADVAQAARECLTRRCHDADVLADMLGLAG